MPRGPAHDRQYRKNVTLALILVALMGLFFAITLMKMSPQ